MLFKKRFWAGLQDGSIRLAFRRWKKAAVRPGGQLRLAGVVLAFDQVEVIDEQHITHEEAQLAGYTSRDELLAELGRGAEGHIYRIVLRPIGPDGRLALREQAELSDGELQTLARRVEKLGALAILQAIAAHPGRRAAELAAELGRETLPFKLQVRKLKEHGLTESLAVGYRLSPRGQALLAHLTRE